MGFDLPVMNRLRRSGRALSPASLFATGAQGVIYDPRDLSTMFQDAAGTTPVTAPGQVVGLRLDKSEGLALGNELSPNIGPYATTSDWVSQNSATLTAVSGEIQITAGGAFSIGYIVVPVSSGRWYEATATARRGTATAAYFGVLNNNDGTVVVNGFGVSALTIGTSNTTRKMRFLVPVGCTAVRIIVVHNDQSVGATLFASSVSTRELAGNHAAQATAGDRLTYGIEPKTGTRNLLLATDTLATQSLTVAAVPHTLAFTGTGTVTLSGASTAGPLVGTGAGNRVTLTFTPTAASLTLTVSGSVTLGQLQLGSTDTPYQKVVTAFEVTEAGVPTCHYCAYAGANSMATAAIDFSATDKMSVFAGVRKLSDATSYAMVAELSSGGAIGSFALMAPYVGATYGFDSKGSVNVSAVTSSSFAAPINNILTGLGNISGDLATLRVNGIQAAQTTTDQGTGNYGNHILYIGRRGGSTLPFTGRDYGIVIVGKATSAAEINITEAWLAANTPTVVL